MNNPGVTPKQLNWVKEREACSLLVTFDSLRAGVQNDIEIMQELFKDRGGFRFVFHTGNNQSFSATRRDDPNLPIGETVVFALGKDKITVSSRDSIATHELFSATVALDDDGACKLLVNGERLEQWQVRRRALEALLFV